MKKNIFIDPPSSDYYQDRLFSKDLILNRDNCLSIFRILKKNYTAHTADYLLKNKNISDINYYYSFGITENYKLLSKRKNVILQDFYIMEPPVVAPQLYKHLPELTKFFNRVFVHNTEGIGYSLKRVNKQKLHKLYWPQTYNKPLNKYWSNKKRRFLCLINSNKKPARNIGELYSKRIEAIVYFAKHKNIDLYGPSWNKIFPNKHFYWPIFKHHNTLISIYRGKAKSKYKTLSEYKFILCFENMIMPGYITEKIFDCLFSGTIPIYLGAPDISNYVNNNCFIDFRDFNNNYDKLQTFLLALTDRDLQKYRLTGKKYLNSKQYNPFTKECFAKNFSV